MPKIDRIPGMDTRTRRALAGIGSDFVPYVDAIKDVDLGSFDFTTTGLGTFGNLDVDTLNLNDNVISDSTGEVSFDDDNIATTGTIIGSRLYATNGDNYIEAVDNALTLVSGATLKFDPYGNVVDCLDNRLQTTGELRVDSDSNGLTLGDGQDAKIHYNGTNLIIDPKVVGSGYVDVEGDVHSDGLVVGTTGGGTITEIYDEDDMASDSQTGLATQQSIKAYVDNTMSGGYVPYTGANSNLDMGAYSITAEHLATTDDLEVADDILLASGSVINWDTGDVTLTHAANKVTLAGGDLWVSQNIYTDVLFIYNDASNYMSWIIGGVVTTETSLSIQANALSQNNAIVLHTDATETGFYLNTDSGFTHIYQDETAGYLYITTYLGEISFDNENLTTTGTITAEHLKTTDDLEVADDILLSSGAVLNWDSGDITLTHSANLLTLAGCNFTITGVGTNAAITVNQGADSKGISVVGYDDENDQSLSFYIDSYGWGNMYCSNPLQFYAQGTSVFTILSGGFTFKNDKYFRLGHLGNNARFMYSTAQTNPCALIGLDYYLGSGSLSLLIVDVGDMAFDFQHADQATPTVFIHSAAQSTTQWGSFTHDGTDFVFNAGTGKANFSALDITTTGSGTLDDIEINGDLNHDGSNIGFFGVVPTAQEAHIADAAAAAGDPPTQAEFNALVTKFNALLASLEAYGILANA